MLEENMKKKIPLLFFASLIIIVAIVLYNYTISLEQSLKATNQLLISQGKSKSEIDSTLSMMASQNKITFLKNISMLLFGVLIGAVPTFILYQQQMRNQKKEEEIKIISDTLKYIFKSNDAVNNLLTDRLFLDKCKTEWPAKVAQVEKEMYLHFDSEIQKDFFPNLMLHSFHLKRLSDQSFWVAFEKLINTLHSFAKMLMDQKEEKEYSALGNQYKSLMKDFVDKCINKARINL
jgi:hypothetical protein